MAPRRQRRWWLDARVVWGIALVGGCALLGARLVTLGADDVMVWQVTRDLGAGAVVTSADLRAAPVAPDIAPGYLGLDVDPQGRLVRDVRAGELLALSSVDAEARPDVRWLTLPVEPLHAPADLAPGDRVDVWSTPDADLGAASRPRLVLPEVLIASVDVDARGLGEEIAITVEVAPGQAEALLTAARGGAIDLVRVPVGGSARS